MECLECGQTYPTDSMATAKQCSGCARIETLEAENAALREATERLLVMQGDVMADVIYAHSIKIGWTGWRAQADRDFRSALRRAFERLRAALARQTEGEG